MSDYISTYCDMQYIYISVYLLNVIELTIDGMHVLGSKIIRNIF